MPGLSLVLGSIVFLLYLNDATTTEVSYEEGGALYPQAGVTRDLFTLDGIWNFRKSPSDPEYGIRNEWFKQDLAKTGPVIPMPVPSSYNDIGEEESLRDHVGLVWYDRRFYVPSSWKEKGQRIWLRFGSVHYRATVYVNGQLALRHEIGHLPFEGDISSLVHNGSNLVTVVVDNSLDAFTIPQGYIRENYIDRKVRLEQTYTFDFFNYAGIHRSVFVYSTPQTYIDDVIVNTDVQGMTGLVVYNISYKGLPAENGSEVQCLVQMFDKDDIQVVAAQDCAGLLEISNANLWWPYLMHFNPGYIYMLRASLIGPHGEVVDTYDQKIGIRAITWTNTTIFINEKPIYLRGFGMHEDSDLRGKGWDPALWVKNFNLIKWLGANAFRTSHYPYAEEIYQLADEQGIMIIDECPAVDTDHFSTALLMKHKKSLTELIRRDKNHPSVIMWSISNEPRTADTASDNYFKEVAQHVKSMDFSRPVTMSIAVLSNVDKAGKHLDVISFNRYHGWYINPGKLYTIAGGVYDDATNWFKKHNKPIIMSEYGADTYAGLHLYPEFVWSEEYQVALMSEHFKAFDKLRKTGFFNGEFIWNFADFKTAQTYTRVGGNKKGLFTRNRQPKRGAFHIRTRYHELAAADSGIDIPIATSYYTSNLLPAIHEEL